MNVLGSRTENGHYMTITVYTGQGGEYEDLVFWCHTCDPQGFDTDTFDLRTTKLPTALIAAQVRGNEHAELPPRRQPSPPLTPTVEVPQWALDALVNDTLGRCNVCTGHSPTWDGHDTNPPCRGYAREVLRTALESAASPNTTGVDA